MGVYDFKTGPQGEILTEKARVVILGNRQGGTGCWRDLLHRG